MTESESDVARRLAPLLARGLARVGPVVERTPPPPEDSADEPARAS